MKKLVIAMAFFFATNAVASVTYTKNELNSMAASGQYPEQESPVVRGSEYVGFGECKSSAYSVYSQVVSEYPAKIVADTDVLYVVKVWTNDGAIVVSCSQPDSKKTVTQSAYR